MKGPTKGPIKEDIVSASSEDCIVLLGDDHATDHVFVTLKRSLQVSGLQIPLLHLAVVASCRYMYIYMYTCIFVYMYV